MDFSTLKIGFALTGSFCTFQSVIPEIKRLSEAGAQIVPILSYAVDEMDTRFYKAADLKKELLKITGNPIIKTIVDAEPIGPKALFDILVIAPCTGNTLAKIAGGINDTPVTMAVKSQLRNKKPVLISLSTNDGLSASQPNIGCLLNRKNIFFVPFGQDDPSQKANSLVADSSLIPAAIEQALHMKQIQPVLV